MAAMLLAFCLVDEGGPGFVFEWSSKCLVSQIFQMLLLQLQVPYSLVHAVRWFYLQ
jgi:hypothetical protein